MAEKNTIEVVTKAIESSRQRNFKESVEIAINLRDIDLSIPKNRIEEEIILPRGRGKPIKVAVFASGELAFKAKKVADLVVQPEEIEDLASNKKKVRAMAEEYDFFVAEAPLMPIIGKRLGVVLGPRGKMPRPIPPSADPAPVVNALRNTVRIRSRERRTFHAPIGTKDMSAEDIAENIDAVLKRILAKLERGKMNVHSAYVKTTMGPSVRLM